MNFDFSVYVEIARSKGDWVHGLCPLHDDRSPSFSGNVATGFWMCHAGCGLGQLEDLEFLLERCGIEISRPVPNWTKAASKQRPLPVDWSKVAEYMYFDPNGFPKLRVTRLEDHEGKKSFIQETCYDGIWTTGGYSGELAPFHFHIWKEKPGPIFLVEGEKCANALLNVGLLSSTTPGGAFAWKDNFAKFFFGHEVVVIPDNDGPGKQYAHSAIESLYKVGVSPRLVLLPGLAESEDVYEWLVAGGTKEKLLQIAYSG